MIEGERYVWAYVSKIKYRKSSITSRYSIPLQWRHNGRDCVSNHQSHDCLHNRLFRNRSKKKWKLRTTGLCAGNSPVTGEFPAQITSDVDNVSIWWRHHAIKISKSQEILEHITKNTMWYWLGEKFLTIILTCNKQTTQLLLSTLAWNFIFPVILQWCHMSFMAFRIAANKSVYSTVYQNWYQRTHQSPCQVDLCWENHGLSFKRASNRGSVSMWWRYHQHVHVIILWCTNIIMGKGNFIVEDDSLTWLSGMLLLYSLSRCFILVSQSWTSGHKCTILGVSFLSCGLLIWIKTTMRLISR